MLILGSKRVLLPEEVTGLIENHAIVVIAHLTDQLVDLAKLLFELSDTARLGDKIVVEKGDLRRKLCCIYSHVALEFDIFDTEYAVCAFLLS